jgi:hypothetical protein
MVAHSISSEFLGICSINRPEWILSDLCTVQYNFVSVPIVVTVEEDVLAFMINEAEIRCVVVTADLVPKVMRSWIVRQQLTFCVLCKFLRVQASCPTLRGLVVIGETSDSGPTALRCWRWEEVLELGQGEGVSFGQPDGLIA